MARFDAEIKERIDEIEVYQHIQRSRKENMAKQQANK